MRLTEDRGNPGVYTVGDGEGITLTTSEEYWAFLSTGPGYAESVSFFGNLAFESAPARSQALVRAAGRRRPIALFGDHTSLTVSGSATLIPGEGTPAREIEQFIMDAGMVCYRDPSGRRIFGPLTGSISEPSSLSAEFTYQITEAT